MKHPCLFSVVIPTFNRAKYLREALESVFLQDVPGLQVIVIDDGSTDDTRSVAAEYGSRVEYVYQENRGPGAARNHGVRRARGEFVAFLDSDDVWLPGKLRAEGDLFGARPEADVIISDCELWHEHTLVTTSWLRFYELDVSYDQPDFMPADPPYWIHGSIFATCCLTLRRAALESLGPEPFDSALPVYEDWDFEIRMLRLCCVLINPSVQAVVRQFDDGTRDDRGSSVRGHVPTPDEFERNMAALRYRVVTKALAMGGWSDDVVKQLEQAQQKHASTVATYSITARVNSPGQARGINHEPFEKVSR
jgi:glycosyltransferase involved in cell wall biosynthesis